MFRMFLIIYILTFGAQQALSGEVKTTKISTAKDAFLDKVLVQDSGEIPVGSGFLIKVKTPKNSLKDVEALLYELDRILPPWYKQIIFFSKGNNECQVIINDIDYTLLIETFTWESIMLKQKKLYSDIKGQGLDSKILIDNAITYSLCAYIKTKDMVSAKQVFNAYRKN